MKILYITQFFYPEIAAAATRAYDNATIWQRIGHEVTVFTGYPNFPGGKLFSGWKMKMLSEEYRENVRVLRNRIIVRPNKGAISRLILYLSFPVFGIINMVINKDKIDDKYDIVLATSGFIFAPILGYCFAKAKRKPFVLELRDITFDQILANGSSEKSIGYRIIKALELFYCREAVKIIVVTEGFKSRLIECGVNGDKIDVIYNGTMIEQTDGIKLANNNFVKHLDEILITYFGTLGISQDLSGMIEIIMRLKVPSKVIKLLLIGDGAEMEKLNTYIRVNDLSQRVNVLGSLDKDNLKAYYGISDFCLVSLKNNTHFKNTVPSKIFSIMANKKPIIYIGPMGEGATIIEKANAGISINATRKEDIIDILNEFLILSYKNDILIKNDTFDETINEYGENGYNFVKQNYDREKLAIKYVDVLSEVKRECTKRE